MGATKKDLEEISKEYSRIWAAIVFLMRPLRPIFKLGFLKRRIDNTLGGRVGAISRYAEQGLHDRAVDFAIEALKEYRDLPPGKNMPSGSDFLWFFTRLATDSLAYCEDQTRWAEVLEIAKNLGEPHENYEAATAFLNFAGWKHKLGDYEAALEFAEIASRADRTWGEPDFYMGWYHLVLGGGDAMQHLTEAIRKDHRILLRIVNDPECRQHPHIVQQLKSLAKDQLVID